MADTGSIIPGHYIVVFNPHVSPVAADQHIDRVHGAFQQRANQTEGSITLAGVIHRYGIPGFIGYSGGFDDQTVGEIRDSLDVAIIEPDSLLDTQEDTVHTEENVPSWGLARICRDKRVDNATTYVYSSANGQDTHAYVIDTGIYIEHDEFNNDSVRRARWGTTIVTKDDGTKDNNTKDKDVIGHGTHVAGTIAGHQCGVAKKAEVIAIKVFPDLTDEEKRDGKKSQSRTSDTIKAIEWCVNDAGKKIRRSVINMSLGGNYSLVKNQAVRAAVSAGMTVVVAAGNRGVDAQTCSPASAPEAIAVGATNKNDETWKSSNYGKYVDVLAPGVQITSASNNGKSELVKKTGTSMAAPHVTGVVCCIFTTDPDDPTQSPATAIQLIKKMAGRNEITMKSNQKDTLNLMLNNGMHVN